VFSPPKSKWQAAEDYGIDMSIIEENLRRSPAERITFHQSALELMLALRQAGNELNARLSKTPDKAR